MRNGDPSNPPRLSRRGFLGSLGAAAAAATTGLSGLAGLERADAATATELAAASPGARRRNQSWQLRTEAADRWRKLPVAQHLNNGDEARYPNRIGSYSKGLPTTAGGRWSPGPTSPSWTRSRAATPETTTRSPWAAPPG